MSRLQRRRHPSTAFGTLALVIVLALITTPSVGASTPSSSVGMHTAPYSRAYTSWYNSTSASTCASARAVNRYTFIPRTGTANFGLVVSAGNCKKLPAQAPIGVQVYHELYIDIPLRLHGVHHTFGLNFTARSTASSSVNTTAGCPTARIPRRGIDYQNCYVNAGASYFIQVRLYSAAGAYVGYGGTKTPLTIENYSSEGSSCSANRTCTFTNYTYTSIANYTGTQSFGFNFTPSAGGFAGQGSHYELWIEISTEAYAYVSDGPIGPPPGITASARFYSSVRLNWFSVT